MLLYNWIWWGFELQVLKDGLSTVHVPYSYGFAIILLTVLVKAATFPLTKKQVFSLCFYYLLRAKVQLSYWNGGLFLYRSNLLWLWSLCSLKLRPFRNAMLVIRWNHFFHKEKLFLMSILNPSLVHGFWRKKCRNKRVAFGFIIVEWFLWIYQRL